MKLNRGMSLIELLIVVAIIGFLMAIGLPSFATWLRNVQIRNASEAVLNGMQLARIEALRRNERVSFWMVSLTDPKVMDNSCARSSSGTSWIVSRDDPAGLCVTDFSDATAPRIIQKKAAGDGNQNVSVSASDTGGTARSCVTFNGFGRVEATCNGTAGVNPIARVTFASSVTDTATRGLEIRVTSGGIIRMCDPLVTSTTDPRHC